MSDPDLPIRINLASYYPALLAAAALLAGIAAHGALATEPGWLRWLAAAASMLLAVVLVDWLRRALRR